MHEPGAPGPVVFRRRIRQHRHELEIVVLPLPAPRQIPEVEVLQRAHTPVEDHLALQAGAERILHHALYRSKSRRSGDEYDRLLAVLA